MFNRLELGFKILCGGLALLLGYQCVSALVRRDPLGTVRLPVLASATPASTNAVAGKSTNAAVAPPRSTNAAVSSKLTSAPSPGAAVTNLGRTNAAPVLAGTNSMRPTGGGTGAVVRAAGPRGSAMTGPPNAAMPLGMGGPRGGGRPEVALPAPIQARVDRIVQSEVLAPVMRPLPMALLGIAGKDVFLRAPNGQKGMLREGEELGGAKLIRVGTNRVLIEYEGQKKELMLFSGFGSPSLLGKETTP